MKNLLLAAMALTAAGTMTATAGTVACSVVEQHFNFEGATIAFNDATMAPANLVLVHPDQYQQDWLVAFVALQVATPASDANFPFEELKALMRPNTVTVMENDGGTQFFLWEDSAGTKMGFALDNAGNTTLVQSAICA